jgi:hypothetical protein
MLAKMLLDLASVRKPNRPLWDALSVPDYLVAMPIPEEGTEPPGQDAPVFRWSWATGNAT